MTLQQLKTSFLDLSAFERMTLVQSLRDSRRLFKANSQTKSAKKRVSATKKVIKKTTVDISKMTLQEKIDLLKELQS
jgi:type VI protein secretion system component VasA